jgi:hypothetical protein
MTISVKPAISKQIRYLCGMCDKPHVRITAANKCNDRCWEHSERERINREKRSEICNKIRLTVRTVQELEAATIEFAREYFGSELTYEYGFVQHVEKMIQNHRYVEDVSNTHGAPIGKKTNWGGQHKDYPRHFPGLRVWAKGTCRWINKKPEPHLWERGRRSGSEGATPACIGCGAWGFDQPKHGCTIAGLHTGTFNGGHEWSGEMYIFFEDFPLLAETHGAMQFLKVL